MLRIPRKRYSTDKFSCVNIISSYVLSQNFSRARTTYPVGLSMGELLAQLG